MGDPYILIKKRIKSKNIISKVILERELNKIFQSRNIEQIIKIGTMIDDSEFQNYYQDKLIELGNPNFIYLYAKYVKYANIEKLEKAIIKFNRMEYIYVFLKDIKNCNQRNLKNILFEDNHLEFIKENIDNLDKKFIEEQIISTKKADLIFDYLLSTKPNNINKLEDAIIIYGTSEDIINYSTYIKNVDIDNLENKLIQKKDYRTIYKLAVSNKKANIEKLQNSILNSNHPKYIYRFALLVDKADIKRLEEALIKTDSLKYMYKFLENINTSDKDKIIEGIINSNNSLQEKLETLIAIAENVNNINISTIEKYIIDYNCAKYIYIYAMKSKNPNILLLEDKLIELKQINYLCYFALYVKGANINRIEKIIRNNLKNNIDNIKIIIEFYETLLENNQVSLENYTEAIISTNNAKYMYDFLKRYQTKEIFEKIETAIINFKDGEYIYKIAKLKNNDDIKREEDALVDNKDYIYLTMLYLLKDANKKRIEELVLNCNIAEYIYFFALRVPDCDIDLIEKKIIETEDKNYNIKFKSYKEMLKQKENSEKNEQKIKIMQKK